MSQMVALHVLCVHKHLAPLIPQRLVRQGNLMEVDVEIRLSCVVLNFTCDSPPFSFLHLLTG